MKEQYIENIRQACIKANPSILDLKFGCQIQSDHGVGTFVKKQIGTDEYICFFVDTLTTVQPEYVTILGRDIHLVDILNALWKFTDGNYSVFYNGDILDTEDNVVAHWDLKNDSLELQSVETLEFINNLLK